MHQTVGNVLRALLYTIPPRTGEDARLLVDEALATAQFALRAAVSTSLNTSPGDDVSVFDLDMFLEIHLLADWQLIQ